MTSPPFWANLPAALVPDEAEPLGRPTEDDEDEPARPSRKRKRKRCRFGPMPLGQMNPALILAAVVAGGCLLLALGSVIFPPLALVPAAIAGMSVFGAYLWILMLAFADEIIHGLARLLIPCYRVHCIITHFEEVKTPVFLALFGVVIAVMTSCAGAVRGTVNRNPFRHRVQLQAPLHAVSWFAFAPDGKSLVSMGDNRIVLSDPLRGRELRTPEDTADEWHLVLSPDRKTLATCNFRDRMLG